MKNLLTLFVLLFCTINLTAQDVTPKPTAVLGSLTKNGEYVRSDIILQDKVVISSNENLEYKITSFDMIIAPKEGEDLVYKSESEKITTEMHKGLNTIVEGDRVIIENIQVSKNNGPTVMASTIALAVKGYVKTPFQELPQASGVSIQIGSTWDAKSLNQEYLVQQTELTLKVTDSIDYVLESFNLIIAPKAGTPTYYSNKGSSFSKNAIVGIRNLKSEDKIIIERILVTREVAGLKTKYSVVPQVITVR